MWKLQVRDTYTSKSIVQALSRYKLLMMLSFSSSVPSNAVIIIYASVPLSVICEHVSAGAQKVPVV